MRTRPLAAAVALVALPLVIAAVEALSFHVATRNNGTMLSDGDQREYLLYVPKGYDGARPAPLVMSFHAAASWPAAQRDISRWNEVADDEGFLVVYPAGTGRSRIFHVNEGPGLPRDVRFVADLIDRLQKEYRIDPARIYADGLSNGGGMSFALSCTLSDRIAAVGLVAAARTLPWSWCTDRRPVPMIAFHGTADRFVPYEGGVSPVPNAPLFPNVPLWTASWARRNRCAEGPHRSRVAPDVLRSAYTACAAGADVVLYTIEGGGHTWPGGAALPDWVVGHTSRGVDATREMWRFFREHPRR